MCTTEARSGQLVSESAIPVVLHVACFFIKKVIGGRCCAFAHGVGSAYGGSEATRRSTGRARRQQQAGQSDAPAAYNQVRARGGQIRARGVGPHQGRAKGMHRPVESRILGCLAGCFSCMYAPLSGL
jgi:hypothetical protein